MAIFDTYTLIDRAKMVALFAHCNQKYGDYDYEKHLNDVAEVAHRFGFHDSKYICASWLHDTVEDQQVKLSLIEEYFGSEIATIVHCCTNELGKNRRERNEKTYPKLRKNQEALIVKLCDRIANVENCIATNNSGLLEMYTKEHAAFRYMTREVGINEELWKHLDSILKYDQILRPEPAVS